MGWKNLLESISESVSDHLRLRNAYLLAENRILRNQIDGRVQLTDGERKELAEMGTKLGKKALEEIATVVQADTILAWNRRFADHQVGTSKPHPSVGRPRIGKEIEDLVVRMARENRSWGYDRIQGALKHLGYTISDQTVGHILKRHGILAAPERQKTVTWREFVRIHLDLLLATDFFSGEVWSGFGLMISSFLWFVHFVQRRTYTVVIGLYHHRQGLSSLVRWPLDVSAHGYRWMPVVMKCLRFQELRCGEAMLETTVSALVSCDEGPPQSHTRGQVVVGVVNLLPVEMINAHEGARWPEASRLCGGGEARDVLPGAESLPQLSTIFGGGEEVTSRAEVLRDGTICREEALGVS
jgi:Homeodomain-like domain